MTKQTETAARKPTHRIYLVVGDGDKAKWTPVAACWPHKDQKGFAITLDAIPLNGRIVMREIKEPATEGQS